MKTRRVSFDLPEDIFDELHAAIPHGMRGYIYRKLTLDLIEKLTTEREAFLTRLYADRLQHGDILPNASSES